MTVLRTNPVVVVATVIPMLDPALEEEAHRVTLMEMLLVGLQGGDLLPTVEVTPAVVAVVEVVTPTMVTTEIIRTIAVEAVVIQAVMILAMTMTKKMNPRRRRPPLIFLKRRR